LVFCDKYKDVFDIRIFCDIWNFRVTNPIWCMIHDQMTKIAVWKRK